MRHELHLARVGFLALAAVGAAAIATGAVVAGGDGARSAGIGVALVALNHAVAIASTAWSRSLGAGVIAVSFGVFVFRMLFMLGAFGSLGMVGWIHDTLLATSFCAALVVSLGAECFSYVRGSYVPAWMRRQAPPVSWRTQ